MKNSINVQAVIEGIRSRKDRSLGLTVTTPELSVDERSLFFELQGIIVDLIIKPTDEVHAPEIQVDKDINPKSASKRLRSVIYILWKQNNEGLEFDAYYNTKMEKIIEFYKGKIEE